MDATETQKIAAIFLILGILTGLTISYLSQGFDINNDADEKRELCGWKNGSIQWQHYNQSLQACMIPDTVNESNTVNSTEFGGLNKTSQTN